MLSGLNSAQSTLLVGGGTLLISGTAFLINRKDSHKIARITAQETAFTMVSEAAEGLRDDVRLAREDSDRIRVRLLSLEKEREGFRTRIVVLEEKLKENIELRSKLQNKVLQLEEQLLITVKERDELRIRVGRLDDEIITLRSRLASMQHQTDKITDELRTNGDGKKK